MIDHIADIVYALLALAALGIFGAAAKRAAAVIENALEVFERVDKSHRQERRELAVRIQTPELAPAVAFEPVEGTNQGVRFDDDQDFHEKVTS